MRVLLVTNHFRTMGGAETVVSQTAALLAAAGHEPIVFASEEPDAEPSPSRSYWPRPAP